MPLLSSVLLKIDVSQPLQRFINELLVAIADRSRAVDVSQLAQDG